MNHLNLFNPYRNKLNSHEDELTRNFLILVKNIPLIQVIFFVLIKNEMKEINVDSIIDGDLFVEDIYTQLSSNNSLFSSPLLEGRTLISIIISDDKLEDNVKVKNDTRQARYDGVITANPSWLFIIENKPSKENIWTRQLNPNIPEDSDITIVEEPCCLSWRAIISKLNVILQKNMVNGLEYIMIENFIEYVDNEYHWLNPYTNFDLCKGNIYLLNKRCIAIMESSNLCHKDTTVKYHKGWRHYIESGKNTIKQISLDANAHQSSWTINLWLYAGDTMNSSKEVYEKLNIDGLLKLQEQGFKVEPNFHISYRSSNLLWFKGNLNLSEYLTYWKKEYKTLKQIKRSEFGEFFNKLIESQNMLKEEMDTVQEKILSKNYDKLNICPGIKITYLWESEEAIKLDKSKKFEKEFKSKVLMAFDTLGGI